MACSECRADPCVCRDSPLSRNRMPASFALVMFKAPSKSIATLGKATRRLPLNMPLVEGMKLAAKAEGRAEVEFEDGSTVRITPDTKIEFTALSLQDSGAKVSTVTLTEGLAYFDYTAKQKDNAFTVIFKDEKVRPEESVRFRVNLEDANAVVAVFNGELKVDGLSGPVEVSKNQLRHLRSDERQQVHGREKYRRTTFRRLG